MSDFVKMRSPLETARRAIRQAATARALDHCADIIHPDADMRDTSTIAEWAAHFAVEMMRELHKDDEIRQEAIYEERLKMAYITPPRFVLDKEP